MIIVDTALAEREASNRPIRVALVGGGYIARCIALQFLTAAKGMRLVAIANRSVEKAQRAYNDAGVADPVRVASPEELERAVESGRYPLSGADELYG